MRALCNCEALYQGALKAGGVKPRRRMAMLKSVSVRYNVVGAGYPQALPSSIVAVLRSLGTITYPHPHPGVIDPPQTFHG